jgi:hypothetical protein
MAYAGSLSLAFAPPGTLADRLILAGYVSSGSAGRTLRPYFPVTSISEGDVYTPSLAGLYTAKLAYQVRPVQQLYCALTGRYFWRTLLDIIPGISAVNNSSKYNLGAELYAFLTWTAFSDLSLNLGGGMFFPAGPVKEANTPRRWKIEVVATLSL